jgi:hypothetical protein
MAGGESNAQANKCAAHFAPREQKTGASLEMRSAAGGLSQGQQKQPHAFSTKAMIAKQQGDETFKEFLARNWNDEPKSQNIVDDKVPHNLLGDKALTLKEEKRREHHIKKGKKHGWVENHRNSTRTAKHQFKNRIMDERARTTYSFKNKRNLKNKLKKKDSKETDISCKSRAK